MLQILGIKFFIEIRIYFMVNDQCFLMMVGPRNLLIIISSYESAVEINV